MHRWKTLVLAALCVPAGAAAQSAPQAYSLYMLSGGDTLAVEQVVRTDERLNVDMLVQEQGVRFRFVVELTPDGGARRVTNEFFRQPGDERPTQVVTVSFDGDSADVEVGGNVSRNMRVSTSPGALPWILPSNALIEQALLRSRAMGAGTDTIPFFNVANGRTAPAVVEWTGPTTATIRFAEATMTARVAGDGSLEEISFLGGRRRVVREEAFGRLPIEEVDYGPPEGAPYEAEEVTVETREGLSLSGTLTLPRLESGSAPAVVTITGSGRTDRDERIPGIGGYRPYWELADTLARIGIATLRLDDRGVNDSDEGPPDATFVDLARDVRAALDYLRSRSDIDPARLALVGHSEGGLVAPLVVGSDSSLAVVVLLAAPAYHGSRALEAQRVADLHPRYARTEQERAEALERSRRADSARAARDPSLRLLMEYAPIPAARRIDIPVLIVHGETDRQVTPEQADTLAEAIREGGNQDVTVRRLPEVNHLLLRDPSGWSGGYRTLPSKSVSRDVLGVIADWLSEQLTAPQA